MFWKLQYMYMLTRRREIIKTNSQSVFAYLQIQWVMPPTNTNTKQVEDVGAACVLYIEHMANEKMREYLESRRIISIGGVWFLPLTCLFIQCCRRLSYEFLSASAPHNKQKWCRWWSLGCWFAQRGTNLGGGLVVMFSQAPGCRVKSSLSTIYWWYFNFSAIVSVRFFPVVFVCFNFILYVYFLCNFFAFCNFNRILSTMKNTRPSSYYYYTAQKVSWCIWIVLIYIVDVHTYVLLKSE